MMQPPDLPQTPSLPMPRFSWLRVFVALILREMSTTYGASPGGYIWAIISPIGAICVMAVAFSFIVHVPPLGSSFIVFYASGYLPFGVFNHLSGRIGGAINYSRPLLAYPRVSWIDTIIARFTLNFLTEILIFCLVMGGILAVVDAHTVIRVGPIIEGMSMMALLGMGVGLMNCLLTGYFPIWPQIWGIMTRPIFIVAGIFFLVDDLPRDIRTIIEWIPISHGVALVRSGFYPTYHPQFVSLPFCFGIALSLIVLALVFLRRGYLRILER